jgi:hypothetical protein
MTTFAMTITLMNVTVALLNHLLWLLAAHTTTLRTPALLGRPLLQRHMPNSQIPRSPASMTLRPTIPRTTWAIRPLDLRLDHLRLDLLVLQDHRLQDRRRRVGTSRQPM